MNIVLNFLFLGINLVFPFAMRSIIRASVLGTEKAEKLRLKYEVLTEGANTKTVRQRLFHFYFIARRLVSAAVLVFLE